MKLLTSAALFASLTTVPVAKAQTFADVVVVQHHKVTQLNAQIDACYAEADRISKKEEAVLQEAYNAAKDEAAKDKAFNTAEDLERTHQEKLDECSSLLSKVNDAMNTLSQACRAYTLSTIMSKAPARAADLIAVDVCKGN